LEIILELSSDLQDESLLEKFLLTISDSESTKKKYEEIKTKYSFTDLLNLKLSDDIYHPKSYFAFIEINKVTRILERPHINSLHIADTHDYLDALYQLRQNKDNYIFLSKQVLNNTPPHICAKSSNNYISIQKFTKEITNKFDLISINYDDINEILKYVLLSFLVQKQGGNIVVKIKRLNTYISKEIIYLLMSMYDNIMIIKPKIINSVNEYKYLVATGFQINKHNEHIEYIMRNICYIYTLNHATTIKRFLNIDIPQILINKVDECELIMSENTLTTHMKILNSIHVNNINLKSLDKKNEYETSNWIKENKNFK
jgi:formylmethanofuran dehydrogenase subunit D